MWAAANHGWTMYPGLLHGAYDCLRHHADPALQATVSQQLARLREDSANLGLLVGECGQPLEQALGPAGTPGELVYEDGTRIALRLDAEGRLPAQARSGYAQLSLEQREWAVAMAPPLITTEGRTPNSWGSHRARSASLPGTSPSKRSTSS